MRVLGYSSLNADDGLMSPTPVDCFEYAKLAASKMLIPGTPQQPVEERMSMVQEVLTAQSTDYPSERAYKKGITWLRLACDNLIKQGDYKLAMALYDPVPEWAPTTLDYVHPTTPAEIPGDVSSAGSLDGGESGTAPDTSVSTGPSDEAANNPVVSGPCSIPVTQRTPTTAQMPMKLVPDGSKPKSSKRKRAKSDNAGPVREKLQPGTATQG